MNNNILIAKIVALHGIDGGLKVMTYLEDPNELFSFKNIFDKNGNEIKIKKKGNCKNNIVLAKIDGVEDRNKAESLRNLELYIKRSELKEPEEGKFYINDLLQMKVISDTGINGKIVNVYNYGAGDVLEIKWENGRNDDIPFNDDYVKNVDVKNNTITINMPTYI